MKAFLLPVYFIILLGSFLLTSCKYIRLESEKERRLKFYTLLFSFNSHQKFTEEDMEEFREYNGFAVPVTGFKNDYLDMNSHPIDFSFISEFKKIETIGIYGSYFKKSDFKYLENLTSLKEITIACYDCEDYDDEIFFYLKNLLDLEKIQVGSKIGIGEKRFQTGTEGSRFQIKIEGSGFQYLSNLPKLREINLYNLINFKDEGFLHIAKIPNLKIIDIRQAPSVTDEGMKYLSESRSLIDIWVSSCKCKTTNKSIEYLSNISTLQRLKIDAPNTTDDDMAYIRKLRELTDLSIVNGNVTGKGLKHLLENEKLQSFGLSNNKGIDDSSVNEIIMLRNLKHLDFLYIRENSLSPEKRKYIKSFFPKFFNITLSDEDAFNHPAM